MTDTARATLSEDSFNWPVAARGLLASLCLLGFSSAPNSSWLIFPAIAVLAYTIYVGAPVRRVISSSSLRRLVTRWCPRLLGVAAAILIASVFADGPGVFAAVGSLLFIVVLLVVGGFACLLLWQVIRRVPAWARGPMTIAYQQLHLQIRLVWLSLAP